MAADAAASAFCLHCGVDHRKDEPIKSGDVEVDPRGDVFVAGQRIHFSPSQRDVLFALIKAGGRTVSGDALLGRLGSDGDLNLTRVHVRSVREKLGIAQPGRVFIETIWGTGYRWAGG